MSVANSALLYNLGLEGFSVTDGLTAGVSGARATALRLPSQLNRITSGPANGAAVLPSILTLVAANIVFVINDGANALVVGAGAGETVNGAATNSAFSAGTLSIPSGESAIFVPVPNGKGGTLDWRAAVIP